MHILENAMSDNTWENIHKDKYAASDWIDKPSLFAETAVAAE
jgi:hypothetical protein